VGEVLTQWRGSGRSRTSQSPCAGGSHGAAGPRQHAGRILAYCSNTNRPEVVDQHVEDAQDHDQDGRAPLRLESDDNHDARNQTDHADQDSPDAPVALEDEANEEEDQQDSTGELEVHLPVFLVQGREAGRRKSLADPAVRQDHQKTAHDGEVAEEEVEVKDEAVANALKDHDAH
jgi:hypothetical protein